MLLSSHILSESESLSDHVLVIRAGPEAKVMLEGLAGDPTMRAFLGPPFGLAVASGC